MERILGRAPSLVSLINSDSDSHDSMWNPIVQSEDNFLVARATLVTGGLVTQSVTLFQTLSHIVTQKIWNILKQIL